MSVRKRVYRYGRKQVKRQRLPVGLIAGAVVLVLLLGAASFAVVKMRSSANARPLAQSSVPYANDVEKQAVSELHDFGSWLKQYNVKAFVGELGWPAGADSAQWNGVAKRWFQAADSYDMWTTVWAAGSWWENYPLTVYARQGKTGGLATANPQATVIEKYRKNEYGDRRGVNLAGMEFGTTIPGTAGIDYFYEPLSSFVYLKERGIYTVRLPFSWERVQPQLSGPLAKQEITAIRNMLDAANKNDIGVVLDLHNYGAYNHNGTQYKLGDGRLMDAHLSDVWVKLSREFKDHPAVIGYGIMNEPHDLPAGSYESPAKNWEAVSQVTVTALRKAGDKQLIMVAGYDWSSLARWTNNHPSAWINDPAQNIRYEAHHYWDKDGSGTYLQTFEQETAR